MDCWERKERAKVGEWDEKEGRRRVSRCCLWLREVKLMVE